MSASASPLCCEVKGGGEKTWKRGGSRKEKWGEIRRGLENCIERREMIVRGNAPRAQKERGGRSGPTPSKKELVEDCNDSILPSRAVMLGAKGGGGGQREQNP